MPINGGSIGLLAMLKIPATVVGGVGGIAIVLSAFGFGIRTPGARLDEFVDTHEVEHVIISDTLKEIDDHLEVQQILMESMVRGECLESAYDKLARQGLSDTCSDLGIGRTAGDAIDRELRRN